MAASRSVTSLLVTCVITWAVTCCSPAAAAPPIGCNGLLDLVFVVDQSESIRENDPPEQPGRAWRNIVDFLTTTLDNFVVGGLFAKVGLVKFSSAAEVMWRLDTHASTSAVQQAVKELTYDGGNTNIASALFTAHHGVLAAKGDRKSIRNVVILITDGMSTLGTNDALRLHAAELRSVADIFVVAIGKYIDEEEIREIVRDFSRNIIKVDDFDSLSYVQSLLVHRMCLLPDPTIGPPVGPTPCTQYLDLGLIIDNSGSIGTENYERLKYFLVQLVQHLNTSHHNIGLVRFSDVTNLEFRLGDYEDNDALTTLISNIGFRNEGTNTAAGLRLARESLFSGSQGDRPWVRNVALLIADGKSNIDSASTLKEAKLARDSGIEIFVIGVTAGINVAELKGIASDPDYEHYFDATDIRYLPQLIRELLPAFCPT